jgi:hypothetical protein
VGGEAVGERTGIARVEISEGRGIENRKGDGMKALMILLAVLSAGAETFTNLEGKVFKNVVIVATNADGIVFKVPGQSGWVKEAFTNLTDAAQFKPKTFITFSEPATTNLFLLEMDRKIKEADEMPDLRTKLNVLIDLMKECTARQADLRDVEQKTADAFSSNFNMTAEALPNVRVMERAKEVEREQIWDDYLKNRINGVERAKRLLAWEQKWIALFAKRDGVLNGQIAQSSATSAKLFREWDEVEKRYLLLSRMWSDVIKKVDGLPKKAGMTKRI